MTIIVEDGTGLSNAQSYVSVEFATAYATARGKLDWAAKADADKEIDLINATDYMVQRYRERWLGYRAHLGQMLDWPRKCVVIEDYGSPLLLADNTVPQEVKNACVELALRASIAALSEDRSARIVQETVGPVTVKYDPYGPTSTIYTAVTDILRPFVKKSSGGGLMKLNRC